MKQSVKLIAGNWKMNGSAASVAEIEALKADGAEGRWGAEVVVFPPSPLIERIARAAAGSPIGVGAQDCRAEAAGAFTGCVSAELLHDAGARWVILGHSERRHGLGESSAGVAAKVDGALRAGLHPVICVGETLAERDAGEAESVVAAQVRESLPDALQGRTFTLAYEPVWAIGTGRTPTPADIARMHEVIRAAAAARLGPAAAEMRVLYGGSVNPANAATLLATPGVDGALVGGASLKAADFLAIIHAA
jgi:triosephosphate isomerase